MNSSPIFHSIRISVYFIFLLTAGVSQAQFAQLYGTNTDNNFSKVIPDGQDYYVLGQEGTQATITRVLSTGAWDWTQKLDMNSSLLDGIVMPNGHLLFVGLTTPFPNQSIIGEIDRNKMFICLKTYESPGNEGIVSIEAINATTYLAVGFHASNTPKDMVIYKISTALPGCPVVQKYQFDNFAGADYARDIVVTGPNSFMICGKESNNDAVIFHYDFLAGQLGGVIQPDQYEYVDIEPAGSDILAAANSLTGGRPHIVRFDGTLFPIWEAEIFGLSSVSQVLVDAFDKIYVVGTANTINRTVILKIDDCAGTCPPSSDWPGNKARYLDNGSTSYSGGYLSVTNAGLLAFVDGRVNPGGLGLEDAFLGVTYADMTSAECMREHQIDLSLISTSFNSPVGDSLFIYDTPSPVFVGADMEIWDMKETCGSNPLDTCVCATPEITLFQNGLEYPLSCLPHGGSTPVVGCPTGTVSIGGFFGCVDPNTGEPCGTETSVTYSLTGPNGGTPIDGGTTTNFTQFLFPPSYFQTNGTYKLTLSTLCPGQQDSCVCMLDWIVECNPCCQDSLAFVTAAQNVQNSGQLGDLCDISFTTDGLTDCSEITFLWGDGQSTGPIVGGSASVSHTYTSGGMYKVCYTVYEVNNIDTCWTYTHCDSIQIVCDTCFCAIPSFSNLYLRGPGGPSIPIQCETSYENIGCPDPGKGFTLTGLFECVGDSCDTKPFVYWDLIGPLGGSVASGSTPGPYFGINLLPAYFAQAGIYTMKLSGVCNFDTCTCEFQFVVDCPTQCPCQPTDISALSNAVNQGFAQILFPNSCKACFSPVALSDCESVDWYLNSTGGTPIGSSLGNSSFCYTFTGSGTYTVIMVVNRKKPDGTDCETFTKSQTVKIFCLAQPGCKKSVFVNSGFDDGATAGGLNSGGNSTGWAGPIGDPEIVSGEIGSEDGWSVELGGNYDSYDVLSTESGVCLNKNSATIMIRTTINTTRSNIRKPGITVVLYNGGPFTPDNCPGDQCRIIANIDLLPLYPQDSLEEPEWFEIEIPFDLRDWMTSDSCDNIVNSVNLRSAVYVTNEFGDSQGADTRSYIQIDNFCFDGELVAVNEPIQGKTIQIYPNPNSGEFTIQLPEAARDGLSLRIVGLSGNVLGEKKAIIGNAIQTMEAKDLPQGMYFLQVISRGRVMTVEKFVKQ